MIPQESKQFSFLAMNHNKIDTRLLENFTRHSVKMEPSTLDLAKVYENKSPLLKVEDVKILREWVNSKRYYMIELDDIDLIFFLCECEFDVERTKKLILGATVFRSRARIFQDIDMRSESLKAAMETILVSCIQPKDDSCDIVIFLKLLAKDVEQISTLNLVKVLLMYTSLWFRGLEPPVKHVIIVDLEAVTLGHLAALDLRTLRELSCFHNHFYFGILSQIHFINAGSWINRLLSLLKSIMGREFSEKICVQRDVNNLHKFISLEHLPKELGGNFLSYHQLHEAMKELLEKHADELFNKHQVQSSEILHIESSYSEPDLFGLDGTFRQLEVD